MRPQGLSFQAFEQTVARMNLDELTVPAGRCGHRDTGGVGRVPAAIILASVLPVRKSFRMSRSARAARSTARLPHPYDGNQWVMSSVLSAFILAHRAGLQPALPREADDWRQYPLVLLPSPLTATDPVFVHLHTDFWERAACLRERWRRALCLARGQCARFRKWPRCSARA